MPVECLAASPQWTEVAASHLELAREIDVCRQLREVPGSALPRWPNKPGCESRHVVAGLGADAFRGAPVGPGAGVQQSTPAATGVISR